MRVRLLKPETFKDEHLAEVSMAARFLFMGLWTLADREGRMEDRPKWIRAELLPYDSGVDVDGLLNELSSPKAFLIRYEVDGRKFIQLTNFLKHQKPHPREAVSNLPAPIQAKASQGQAKVSQGAASRSVSVSDSDSDRDQGRDVVTPVAPSEEPEPTGTPNGTPVSNPWDFDEPKATETAPRRLTPQDLGIRTDPANFAQVQLAHDLTALVMAVSASNPAAEALELLHDISTTPAGKRIETLDLRRISTEWATISSHAAYKLAREAYGVELDPAVEREDNPAAIALREEVRAKFTPAETRPAPKAPTLSVTVAPGRCPMCDGILTHSTEAGTKVLRCADEQGLRCDWAAVWREVAA